MQKPRALRIKKVLVSQPKPTAEKSPYTDIAEQYGIKVEFRSFIKVEGVSLKEFRQERVNILDHTAIIFTSRTAIDHFFRLCGELRVTVPETMKYFCISEAIAFYLQKYIVYRKRKIFYGDKKVEDMSKTFLKHKTENFLVPLSDVHKENVPGLLDNLRIKYSKAVFYKTVASDLAAEGFDISEFDVIIFYTPAGIKSLFQNYPDFTQGDTVIGAFGEATAEAAEEAGLRLDIKAPTGVAPSMTMALEQFVKQHNKK
jgi:uroporphyrinogen-III synthase